jgi:hypothetical protein
MAWTNEFDEILKAVVRRSDTSLLDGEEIAAINEIVKKGFEAVKNDKYVNSLLGNIDTSGLTDDEWEVVHYAQTLADEDRNNQIERNADIISSPDYLGLRDEGFSHEDTVARVRGDVGDREPVTEAEVREVADKLTANEAILSRLIANDDDENDPVGYTEVGGADGFWGSNSAKALAIFMQDNGIEGEPKVTSEIKTALAKAKSRQEIADAKESAVAEANMPAAKVEDGIVHFGPKPDQQTADADAEHMAAEDAVQQEDFTDDDLTPAEDMKTAADTDSAPPAQETAVAPAPESEADIAATEAPKPEAPSAEAPSADVAESNVTPPAAEQEAETEQPAVVEQKQEAVAETKDDGAPQEIDGLTVSGDF